MRVALERYQAHHTHGEVVMNTTLYELLKSATINVELTSSRYGTPSPTLRLTMPKTRNHRETSALMHMLAAEVELAIPDDETWPVTVEHTGNRVGTVSIELIKGTAEEAKRAMAFLRKMVPSQ